MQTRLLADPVNEDLQLRGRGKESLLECLYMQMQKDGEGWPRGFEFRDRFADMNPPLEPVAAAAITAATDDG